MEYAAALASTQSISDALRQAITSSSIPGIVVSALATLTATTFGKSASDMLDGGYTEVDGPNGYTLYLDASGKIGAVLGADGNDALVFAAQLAAKVALQTAFALAGGDAILLALQTTLQEIIWPSEHGEIDPSQLTEGNDTSFNGDLQDPLTPSVVPGVAHWSDSGTVGADILAGTDPTLGFFGNDFIWAGAGNDIVFAGGGDDEIHGQDDNDILWGQEGDDIVQGERGDDILRGGAGVDTLDGGDNADLLFGGYGDDELIGGAGSDTILGGHGSDLILDSLTARDENGTSNNDGDVYIGSEKQYDPTTGLVAPGADDELIDVVRYTVDDLAGNDAGLQREGVILGGLSAVNGDNGDVLSVDVTNVASGQTATDKLIDIETIELSDRADTFNITAAALDVDIVVDMGKSGRIESELPEGETLIDNAFTVSVDTADYSDVDHGLIFIKGVTADHSEVNLEDHVFTTDGLMEELAAIADYSTGGLLGTNHELKVEGADRVVLTDHDDVLISSDYGSIVYTGGGQDKVYFQDGVAIADLSADDRISLMGVYTLYGGLKNGWSESPWAWGPYGTAYGLNDSGELVISNVFWNVRHPDENGVLQDEVATTYLLNYADTLVDVEGGGQLGAGHLFLLEYKMQTVLFRDMTQDMIGKASAIGEGAFDFIAWQMKVMTGFSLYGGADPLVLDLDGDGVELTRRDSAKSRFDIDGDLYAETTGFVGGDDGVLARDINGNGKIDGGDEMFGKGRTSGFEVLKALDGNLDGVVDASDNGLADFNGDGVVDANDDFNDLQIWQDADEDLLTDAGELKSVSEWNITSFAVPTEIVAPGTAEDPELINGNTINQVATYTKGDGTTHTVADVIFRVENQDTVYVGAPITISETVLDLPDLKGYGTLVSLREAMSVRPESETTVRDAILDLNTPVLADLRAAMQPILQAWAMGSPLKIDGVVQTGQMSERTYEDMIFIRDEDGIVDYTTSVTVVGGQAELQFARGARLGVTLANYDPAMTPDEVHGAIRVLLNHFFSSDSSYEPPPSSTVTLFESEGGAVEILSLSAPGWLQRIAHGVTHDLEDGAAFSGASASEFQFYERLTGESLELFFEEPDDAMAGNAALEALLDKMDIILNTFAVRLAVQGGPLAEYFETIDYNVTRDGFASVDDARISDVFHALLVDAELDAAPVDWLAAWEPFMDVFFADYSRGESNLPVSYGYLVQQMMNAVERADGGISVEQFAEAFDIPDGLVQGGAGTVEGRSIEDIILVDGDEVLVAGAEGADNYVIGKSFGTTEIYDKDGALDADFDILRFSAHAASDIIATREGINLLLTDAVTGETLTITNQFEGRWPGPTISDASFDYGISEIVFADGTVWSKPDIALAVSRVDNNSTTVTGTEDIDVLQGGLGDDRLEGGGDTDIYRYSFGDGADTILDHEVNNFRHDNDMLQFLGGIRIGDLLFEREGNSGDLLIKLKDHAGDQIEIEGLFEATYTGVYGNWYQKRIEAFTFDDGSSLSFDQLASLVLRTYSTTGDDQLYGMNREDILIAGKGNDYVSGGNESDIYLFNLGDGQDIYQDRVTNILSGTNDTLIFGAGIAAEDIVFERVAGDNNSLVLRIAGTDDSVTLLGQYSGVYASVFGNLFFDQIETIRFSDESETVWTSAQLAQMVLAGVKTAANDTINGFDVDDIVDGGAGDDFLSGGNGDDIYIWGAGYGNDTIKEGGEDIQFGNENDTVVFQGGVMADDIAVSRGSGNDLVITIINSGETLTLVNQVWYTSINYQPDRVDQFEFSDGSIMTAAGLRQKYLLEAKTGGDDVIGGFYSSDTLDGGAGNDSLYGGDGSDTYIFGYGYGHDVIEEQWFNILYPDDDKVVFEPSVSSSDVTFSRIGGADLLITLVSTGETLTVRGEFYTGNFDMNDVESFVFGDGTVVTEDQLRTLVLTSKTGDETIYGFDKSDIFHYVAGGGHDTFVETVNNGANDKLVFDDLLLSDVTFGRDVNDLLITVSADKGGGSAKLTNSINDHVYQGIEFVQFADGQLLGRAEMRALLVSSSATSGNDTIVGTNSIDLINGGLGDDIITGGGGSDTYVYVRGDGSDTIHETGINLGTQDKLILNSVDVGAVSFGRTGDSLILLVAESAPGAGDGGQITLVGTGSISNQSGIETIVFDDGTIWDGAAFRNRYFEGAYTSGDDTIAGFNTNDSMMGGLGNDVLTGGFGNDTYTYVRGDGHDTINEAGGVVWGTADKLNLFDIVASDVSLVRNGNDVTLVIAESASGVGDSGSILIKSAVQNHNEAGVEQIVFDDGTVWTPQTLRDHLLTSTAVNENFLGFTTSDTYRYSRGGGHDTINETAVLTGNADKLLLLDINPDAISLTRSGNDVTLVIAESGPGANDAGSILIKSAVANWNDMGIEQIVFADSTVWAPSTMRDMLMVNMATSGNDRIEGFGYSETLVGGEGDDELIGGSGNDIYNYSRGDGRDIISETDVLWGNADKLVLTDIASTEVDFYRSAGDVNVVIHPSMPGALDGGLITIRNGLYTNNQVGVEQIQFSDGVTLTPSDLWNMITHFGSGTGNETVTGTTSADSFLAGIGNDTLLGLAGSDTYIYGLGDGSDYIDDASGSTADIDVLRFTDLDVSDLTFSRSGNHALVTVNANGQVITLDDQFYSATANWGIDRIEFADGTIWNRAAIGQASWVRGTANSDTLGTASAPFKISNVTIDMGVGNDTIYGDYVAGNTVIYRSGEGYEQYRFWNSSATTTVLKLSDLAADDISLGRSGNDLLVLDEATGQTISLTSHFTSDKYGLQKISFSDGSEWDRSTVSANVSFVGGTVGNDSVTGTAGNDSLVGGLGNDALNGGGGNDTYFYALGHGNDTITDIASGSLDVLVFANLNAGHFSFAQSGNDLVIGNRDTGETVSIKDQFLSGGAGVERIDFADGLAWDRTQMTSATQQQIYQPATVLGTASAETLTGTWDDDIFHGKGGDDLLLGSAGSDVYLYASGDGSDYIDDEAGFTDNTDVLRLVDLNASDVGLSRNGVHLLITILATGDVITIDEQFSDDGEYWGIERIDFADGASWDRGDIALAAPSTNLPTVTVMGTEASETLTGTWDDDVFHGQEGDDLLLGGAGSDIYIYSSGDGSDYIDDEAGFADNIDVVLLTDLNAADVSLSRNGVHLLITVLGTNQTLTIDEQFSSEDEYWGIERIEFADGVVWDREDIEAEAPISDLPTITIAGTEAAETLTGTWDDDVFHGQEGDDLLLGSAGSDTYIYASGDGSDYIDDEAGFTDNTDLLLFVDLGASDVSLSRDGVHLLIDVLGTGDTIVIDEQFFDEVEYWGIERIDFSDGSSLDRSQILDAVSLQ